MSHYEIVAPLGQGGMGEVYVGVDTTLQRKVALKAVKRERRLDESARGRLLREARILSQLDHPNICRIYDYESGEDRDFIVLELVEGRSLRHALDGQLDHAQRMRIAEQIAGALVAAHAAGVIHRDLKPENVMLLPSGDIKVLDFGLARAAEDVHQSTHGMSIASDVLDDGAETVLPASRALTDSTAPVHTVAGALMGSPMYMSPEQARGEAASAPSDMFSFGLLLQELWTGQRPFDAGRDVQKLLAARARGDTVPAIGLPRDLRDLIERLKSLAPSNRPTAVDAVASLRYFRETPMRRLRYAAAVAALAVIVGAGVKYTVDVTRERTAAIEAREDAVRRRGQAEALIGFMLGDLRAKLQRVGRLDVLDDVGKQAMDYFAAVPAESITDEEIYRRSQAVHQIGQVRLTQGDLKAAAAAFGESLRLIDAVAARNPQNATWQVGLATSHFYVGEGHRLQGNLDAAMHEYLAYRDIARKLVDRDRTNPEWLLELSYAHSNVAGVLEAKGELEKARDELTYSLDVRRPLATIDPNRREWQEAIANSHNRLAVVLMRLGEARAALQHHAADYAIRRQLVDRSPNDTRARSRLAVAASYLSALYSDQGDDLRAREYNEVRAAINEDLATRDPANSDWQRELGIGELRTARLERLHGNITVALKHASRAASVLRPLGAKDPTMVRRARDTAEACVELALLHLLRADPNSALTEANACIELLAPIVAKTTSDAESRRLLAESYLAAAEVWNRRGVHDRAHHLRQQAVDALAPLAPRWKDRRFQVTWAHALADARRRQEAEEVIARLRASGFRKDVLDAIALRARQT